MAVALVSMVASTWTMAGMLSALVVGLLFLPLAIIVSLAIVVVLTAAPLPGLAYGFYVAYQVYQGVSFRYWLVGDEVQTGVKA